MFLIFWTILVYRYVKNFQVGKIAINFIPFFYLGIVQIFVPLLLEIFPQSPSYLFNIQFILFIHFKSSIK